MRPSAIWQCIETGEVIRNMPAFARRYAGISARTVSEAIRIYGEYAGLTYRKLDAASVRVRRTDDPWLNGFQCGKAGILRNRNPWPDLPHDRRFGDGQHQTWDSGWMEGAGQAEPDEWDRNLRPVVVMSGAQI